MKLLLVSERFWPEGSGGTLATYLIAKLIASYSDFRITVITGTPNPAHIDGVRFIIDKAFRIRHKPLRWLYFLKPTVRERYKGLLKEFDIVYIPYGYFLIPLAKELDKRVVVHLHDYQPVSYNSVILCNQQSGFVQEVRNELVFELLEHGNIKYAIIGSLLAPFITKLSNSWIKEADVVICVSQRQAEIISDLVPELAHKIRIIYNPLPETPQVEVKFKQSTFTYSGGDSYIKGFFVFMQATLMFLKRRGDTKFLLLGRYGEIYKELVRRLNNTFAGKFKVFGYLSHEDTLRLYSKSHAVLFPSICEEPLPYTVIEAMIMGTLPIASKIGGIPEIVQGTYAEKMLFPVNNVNEIIDRMEEVLSLSREQLINIGSELREAILNRFNQEVIAQRLLAVFSE